MASGNVGAVRERPKNRALPEAPLPRGGTRYEVLQSRVSKNFMEYLSVEPAADSIYPALVSQAVGNFCLS